MAKIKNYTNYILGEEIIFPIKVSTSGVFSTEVPMRFRQIAKTPGDHTYYGSLIDDICRFCREIDTAGTSVEYAIRYSMSLSHLKVVGNPFGSTNGDAKCVSFFVSFLAVKIETCGSRVSYNSIEKGYLPEGVDHLRTPFDGFRRGGYVDAKEFRSHEHQIPFTVESYEYFEGIQEAIKQLATKMNSLTPDDILLKIESNDNKLLNG